MSPGLGTCALPPPSPSTILLLSFACNPPTRSQSIHLAHTHLHHLTDTHNNADRTKGEFPGNYVQRLKEYALPSQSSPPRSVPAALPAGWAEAKDPASGDTYYFNESTGETAWVSGEVVKLLVQAVAACRVRLGRVGPWSHARAGVVRVGCGAFWCFPSAPNSYPHSSHHAHSSQDKPHVSATEGPRASDHEAMNRLANLSLANEEEEDKATHRTGRRKKGPNGGSSRGPNSKDKTRPANHSHANGYSNGGSRDEDVGFSPSRPTNGFKRTDQSPRVAAHSPEKPWRRGRPNEENFVVEKEQEDENFVVGTGGTGKLKSARQELEEAENERYELEMQRRRAEEEAAERRKIFDEEAARLEEDERKRAEEIEARKMELQQDEYRLKQVQHSLPLSSVIHRPARRAGPALQPAPLLYIITSPFSTLALTPPAPILLAATHHRRLPGEARAGGGEGHAG